MLSLKSYPKINLSLDILKQDASGYHEIKTVFHQLAEPFDEIIIEELTEDKIEVGCDNPEIPLKDANTVLKAAKLLKKQTGIKKGARIFIKKRIPLMSGLGGGSSNAVAVLKGLTKIWNIKCCGDNSHKNSECILRKIADQIGMDCAFFFFGDTALGEHFGEKITPLPALPNSIKFEIIETGVEVSSRAAYQQVDVSKCAKNTQKTEELIEAIYAQNPQGILENLHNDFEDCAFASHLELRKIKEQTQRKYPQSKILLCGSGGALFRAFA